jgi:hypothetical protein
MRSSLRFRLLGSCLVAGAAVVCFLVSAGPVGLADEPSPSRAVYDPDPEHLWNRLYEALFVRVGPDGRAYGQDRLEPLLWRASKHLLEEHSNKRAIALLEEFLKNKGEKLIDDPLKRALLQRDLWLVFNWLEGSHDNFAEPRLEADVASAAQERLRRPLAAVIGRLALSRKEIQELPDNYAAAVVSNRFARRFDPEQPDQSYLPSDLLSAEGPWACVGRTDGITAPGHLAQPERTENRFTNSLFLVFLRLPAGRAATIAYLKQLRSFDPKDPKLPELPDGTQFALVRRALLIDTSHRVAPTALTESVQLRVDRQSFYDFRLSRSQLFAGPAGGLRALGSDEDDFKTGFGAHSTDEFEYFQSGQPLLTQWPIRRNCHICHDSRFPEFRSGITEAGAKRRPLPVSEMAASEVAGAAVKWQERQPGWTALRKLLAE